MIRRRFAALEHGGSDARALWATLAVDVVCEVAIGVSGVDGVYQGRTGVRRFWRRFTGGLRHTHVALEELVDCGQGVYCAVRAIGSGRHSGGVAAGGRVFAVFAVRDDGLIERCQLFAERDRALEAAQRPPRARVS